MGFGQARQRPAGLAPVRPAAVLPEARPVPWRRPGTRVRARQLRRRLRRRTGWRLRRRRGRRRRSNVLGRRLVVLGRRRRPLRQPTQRPRRPEDFYVRTGGPGRLSRAGRRVRHCAGTVHRSDVPVRARQMAVPPASSRLIAIGAGGPVKVRFDCDRIITATTCWRYIKVAQQWNLPVYVNSTVWFRLSIASKVVFCFFFFEKEKQFYELDFSCHYIYYIVEIIYFVLEKTDSVNLF